MKATPGVSKFALKGRVLFNRGVKREGARQPSRGFPAVSRKLKTNGGDVDDASDDGAGTGRGPNPNRPAGAVASPAGAFGELAPCGAVGRPASITCDAGPTGGLRDRCASPRSGHRATAPGGACELDLLSRRPSASTLGGSLMVMGGARISYGTFGGHRCWLWGMSASVMPLLGAFPRQARLSGQVTR
jgi:hypothetical protein